VILLIYIPEKYVLGIISQGNIKTQIYIKGEGK